jgi:hypothetical protein
MSELDKKKLQIEFLQKQFFASLAVAFALLGWVVTNYESTSEYILLLSFFSLLVAVWFVVMVHKKINFLIHEVGKL